jgi:hypothetical protein
MIRSFSAITIWQPWATLIAQGMKIFEFRSWPIPAQLCGKPIAIHSGARPARKPEIRELVLKLQGAHWRETGITKRDAAIELLEPGLVSPGRYPLRAILCLATFDHAMRGAELADVLGGLSIGSQPTQCGWPITEVRRLDPAIPVEKGERGFWTVELDIT